MPFKWLDPMIWAGLQGVMSRKAREAEQIKRENNTNESWTNEFHGVCPQCAEMFILRRHYSVGVNLVCSHFRCTECTAYFEGDLLKQMQAFLKEKPSD